jgi:hypothetical protein
MLHNNIHSLWLKVLTLKTLLLENVKRNFDAGCSADDRKANSRFFREDSLKKRMRQEKASDLET